MSCSAGAPRSAGAEGRILSPANLRLSLPVRGTVFPSASLTQRCSVSVRPRTPGGDRPTRLGQGHLSVGTPKPLHHVAGQGVMQIK